MSIMLDVFKAPYPVYGFNQRRLRSILGIGAFVAFFLIVFQPFGTDQAQFPYKNWFLGGYGLVISGSIILMEAFAGKLWRRQLPEEQWTVGKQFIWVSIYVSVALIACYLYKQWFFQLPIRLSDLGYFYLLGITVAIFPIIIMTLMDYIYQLQRNQKIAANILPSPEQPSEAPQSQTRPLLLKAENEKDLLEIPDNQLFYIQSADNYAEVVFRSEGSLHKSMLRNSLQRLEQQIAVPHIKRCHRSFIVNLQQVEKVSGNAQGYKLHLFHQMAVVPVSRSKNDEILNSLQSIQNL
ncbi:MAG: LytTR family DNA-binding domain-containing protein [Bacteroidota bacterium]